MNQVEAVNATDRLYLSLLENGEFEEAGLLSRRRWPILISSGRPREVSPRSILACFELYQEPLFEIFQPAVHFPFICPDSGGREYGFHGFALLRPAGGSYAFAFTEAEWDPQIERMYRELFLPEPPRGVTISLSFGA